MKKINTLKNLAVGLIMVIMSNITLFFIAQAKESSHLQSKQGSRQLPCSYEFNQEILALPKSNSVIDCDAHGMHCISINGSVTNGLTCNGYNNNKSE